MAATAIHPWRRRFRFIQCVRYFHMVSMVVGVMMFHQSIRQLSNVETRDGTSTGRNERIMAPPPLVEPYSSSWNVTKSTQSMIHQSNKDHELVVVSKRDRILRGRLAPIVVEKYKLIFFFVPKNACSVWKLLFHRMEGVDTSNMSFVALHDPSRNGLRYLSQYNVSTIHHMMTAPDWTRATFLRDPHERLLSAYLDKGVGSHFKFVQKACCPAKNDCLNADHPSFHDFFHVIQTCYDQHWMPQTRRIDMKYWKYINFVGHMETLQEDAQTLLQKIGAWEQFGATGWGTNESQAIFEPSGVDVRKHATGAGEHMEIHYTDELYRAVTLHYRDDYANPFAGLHVKNRSFPLGLDLKQQ